MTRNPETDRQAAFLKEFTRTGAIGDSARAVGLHRDTPRVWASKHPEFARAFEEARQDYIEQLESECDRRAHQGVPRGVYYHGERVGEELEFSDRLMEFRLRALAPEKYRDNKSIEHSGPEGGPINVQHLTDEYLEHLAAGGGE